MKKILLAITILLALYSSIVTYKLNQSPSIVEVHDTIPGDSVFKETVVYKPKPYVVVEYNTDTILIPSDTTELIKRYRNIYAQLYASKTHLDTLKNDSSATVILTTYLSRNTLDSLKMAFKNNRPISINTTIVDNGFKLSGGVIGGYNNISPTIMYKINKQFNISAGYNVYDKSINAGIFYNIK